MKTNNWLITFLIMGTATLVGALVLFVGLSPFLERSTAAFSFTATPTVLTSVSSLAPATAPSTVAPSPTVTPTPTLVPASGSPTDLATAIPSDTPTATATLVPTATSLPAATVVPAPVVLVTYPTAGLTVKAGQQVIVQATASGAAGLARTAVWVDGVLLASTPNPQAGGVAMAIAQPWTSSVPGAHAITVVTYDTLGRFSAPATVNIQVLSQALTTAWFALPYAPSGRIVLLVGDTVQLSYWGSAAAGVSRLELWVDGQLVASDANSSSSTTMNVQHTWSSDTIGDHTLFVRVYDTLNQTTDSTALDIGLADRNPPSVTLVSPGNGAQLASGQTIPVVVSASDSKGITHIDLWIDNSIYSTWDSSVAVGESSVNPTLSWGAPAAGNHAVYVIAYDAIGLSTTTPTIVVSVLASLPTATPTATPTASPTAIPPTSTSMATPTATPTMVPPTATSTATPTASPTAVPPTATPTATSTASPTVVPPAATPTAIPTANPTVVPPTATLTATSTATPTATPTIVIPPTSTSTATPTASPTPTQHPRD